MIANAVNLLLDQLNQHLHQEDGTSLSAPAPAVMGNIAQLDVPQISTELENHLVLSLVNLEEEATLKNGRNFTSEANHSVTYHNSPLHLNLFLLCTANYRNYETALMRLGQVMTFFQGKNKFTSANSPGPHIKSLINFSLTLELLSLSLEEINHLWGSLGGKQLPFALYRGRLISLQNRRILDGGGLIREVDVASGGTKR